MHYARMLCWILVFAAITGTTYGQEFPIAVGHDNTFGGGGAFDGTHYLFAIVGDSLNEYSITLQFISTGGILEGSRISLGQTGSGPMIAFDGTNYLVTWTDPFPMMASGDTSGIGDIYGQFISTSGHLVGSAFTFVTGANIRFGKGRGEISFHDTTYFLTYLKGGKRADYLYGQRISRSGNLLGSPIQISTGLAREFAVAFDGTNYLLAWCEYGQLGIDKDIYGQFVSTSGALTGTNFLIDGGPYKSDNPVTMTFNGSRYLVAFHEQAADAYDRWNLWGRFVTTTGGSAERFMICDSTRYPTYAAATFDGTNYLITWMELITPMRIMGRFHNASGVPLDSAFAVFETKGGKFPFGGGSGFVNGHFIVTATRIDSNFADADLYGMFLQGPTSGVDGGEINPAPHAFALSQNYPNPFNPTTTIRFSLRSQERVSLKIFNVLGEEVATLLDDQLPAGVHSRTWDATGMASGMYFYRLQAGGLVAAKKLVLLR